eukprot:Gregarina_sp_Poly_1__1183@NODE_128_length_13277_cov_115_450643_g114_i0_p4_GENE_NODE_128_length_13277_cov_115_450643_g114_i0NODE_128_length_13277_cov_115_450643_g114_i0_p4_ORF_typecomplete_len457_score56_40Galactosyl_T/PF01762_21/4_8e32Fringe/PF02434_16/0_00042MiAMP1/PF09117_10/0_54_NODE_128_length_13277_cov_115_450643_g114_i063137683
MRMSGNGVVFATIGTIGIILLTVTSRVSSMAKDLDIRETDFMLQSSPNFLKPTSEPSSRPNLRKVDSVPHLSEAQPAFGGNATPETSTDFLRSILSTSTKLLTSSTISTSTTAVSTTTVATTEKLPTADSLIEFPPTITNDTWPFARVLYNPKTPCSKSARAVVAVLTIPTERKMRDWFRSEVANVTKNQVVPVFPMGRPKLKGINDDEDGQHRLERDLIAEAKMFDDVIIADFADSYEDLPRKTMLMFDWFNSTCGDRVKWLIKADADVIVNWRPLMQELDKIEHEGIDQDLLPNGKEAKPPIKLFVDKDPVWLGHRWVTMPVIHDPKHRNFEELPFDLFPPYCSGPSYLMNHITARLIIEQRALNRRYFRNEDAMLGLLLNGIATPVHDERFIVFTGSGWRRAACQKDTESISECGCIWWTYHCGRGKDECLAGLKLAYECADNTLVKEAMPPR